MSELTTFWHLWVCAIVIGSMIACGILLSLTKRGQKHDQETDQTTGHAFDGIEELDNPLPKWWLGMFWATIVFGFVYIGIYGIGDWTGFSDWSSRGQWQKEVDATEEKVAPYFAKLTAMPIEELALSNTQHAELRQQIDGMEEGDAKKALKANFDLRKSAMSTGGRLFASNCSVCHGSTASGSLGFPNLTDQDWLYGGKPEQIRETLLNGRNGAMPANGLKPDMTDQDRADLATYVISLTPNRTDKGNGDAEKGSALYAQACAACHGADAKGNIAVGAPNLTDNIWLYGGSQKQIEFTIKHGRAGVMPPWKEFLGEDKIHVLSAYVYSLSKNKEAE